MKNNKNILVYAIITLVVIMGLFFIWNKFSDSEKSEQAAPVENSDGLGKPKDDTRVFFASNGKTKVYKIKKDNKWSVIWNGKEGKIYDYVSDPVFSPDGTQLAYSAELNGQAWVVLNNEQEFFAYKKATSLVFSPDGTKLAFVAIKENSSIVVVNGEESRDYESVESFQAPTGATSIIFSPDGTQIVYVITEGDKTYVVINGEEGIALDGIIEIYFDENNQLVYEGLQGETVVTIIDNQIVSTETSAAPDPADTSDSTNTTVPVSTPSTVYRYKISTDKDIDLSNDTSIDYGDCQPGADCNF